MTKQQMSLAMLLICGHSAYATKMLRPVCALGKDDRQRSSSVFAIVRNWSDCREQNGLGILNENFKPANVKPNIA